MHDYKSPWWRDQPTKDVERQVDVLATFTSLVLLVLLIGYICTSCVDSIVKTVENEEEQRIFKVNYSRPAAYRLASPTMEQMDHLEALLAIIQKVIR